MDLVRFELTTSSMPWKRAPNCATGPLAVSSQYILGGWRARLPAAVNPKPLLGIFADHGFQNGMKTRGVRVDVTCNGNFRIEAQHELLFRLRPKCEARNDGGTGVSGQARKTRPGAGADAEEVHENSVVERGILIDQNAHRIIGGKGLQDAAGVVFFLDEPIA